MKLLFLFGALLVAELSSGYGGGGRRQPVTYKFKVTVINVTKGQPLTPPVVAFHKDSGAGQTFVALHPSKPASDGLAVLATDGMTEDLVAELKGESDLAEVVAGDQVIMPGQKAVFTFSSRRSSLPTVSVITMLARTNDAIAVVNGRVPAYHFSRDKRIFYAKVYDAGVEFNSEDCAHIPAPPCNNPNSRPDQDGEGFIRPHEGLILHGDLTGQRDSFADVAAKVIVERI